jgi:hypothetical protein
MISTVDLFKEIKIMEEVIKKENDAYKKATLKAAVLNLKLLHNIRTNTVLVMEKFGVEKVKSERPTDGAAKQTEDGK